MCDFGIKNNNSYVNKEWEYKRFDQHHASNHNGRTNLEQFDEILVHDKILFPFEMFDHYRWKV